MTLNLFLLLILILLPLLLYFCSVGTIEWLKKPLTYFVVIALVMVASYWTFAHYAKSHGGYYKNTEYHIIQQDGFEYSKGLLKLASDIAPEKAILATGVGELELDDSGCLSSRNFKLPVYVEDTTEPLLFHVINLHNELYMDNGDELRMMDGNDTLLSIKYEEVRNGKKVSKYRFSFTTRNGVADTVEKNEFKQGYNLGMLLQEGNMTRLGADLQSVFEYCFLVRDHYKLDNVSKDKISDKLYLFVPDSLANRFSIFKNGSRVGSNIIRDIANVPMKNRQFFFGLGETRSEVFKVCPDSTWIAVKYRLPRMYHFPEGDDVKPGEANMFLTTDKQEIIDRRGDFLCFYQFSEQLTNNSIYKVAAVLNFIIDSSGTPINAQLGDLNSDFDQSALAKIVVNKPFEIQTQSCRMPDDGTAKVKYLFQIRDMRDNEVYQNALYLYLIMLILFGAIYLLLHYFKLKEGSSNVNKLYILETSVYLVLIAFLTVRLVLLWRLHTFPPIENVSKMEWGKLINPQNFYWTFVAIVAILIIRIAILIAQRIIEEKYSFNLNDWLEEMFDNHDLFCGKCEISLRNKQFGIPNWVIAMLIPVAFCLICALIAKIDPIKVVSKEALAPLLIFALNSIYYVRRVRLDRLERGDKSGLFCWLLIIWNTIVFLFWLLLPERYLGFGENGMVIPMIGVFVSWLIVVLLISEFISSKRIKVVTGIVSALLLIAVFCHIPIARTSIGTKVLSSIPENLSRPSARIITLCQTPSEMVQNQDVKFAEKPLQDILNAASNKWFIDSHLAQRYYLEKEKNKSGFILDKEYNQNAVSYTTQTRDVVLLRYIIYEHGRGVVIKLLIILLLLTVTVFTVYSCKLKKNTPYLQQLPLHASLFLLIYSTYLFLVNINAVVFIGLDFPFLSLCSGAAPFGLLLPLLAILLPVNINRVDNNMSANTKFDDDDKKKAAIGVVSVVLMLVLVIVPTVVTKKIIKDNGGVSSASFSISMAPLAEFINDYMNPQLDAYQDLNVKLRNKKIDDASLKADLNEFVFGGNDGQTSRIDVALKEFAQNPTHEKDAKFIRSAFERLFKTSLTNTSNIIHIRKLNGKFCFVTNKVYYDMKPMFDNDELLQWHGDLLGAAGASKIAFAGENRKESIRMKRGFYEYGCANDTENAKKLRDVFLGVRNDGIINFNIVQIPKEYCYTEETGDHDIFIISPTDASVGKNYAVYPLGDATNPIKAKNTALWIKPNDIVKVSGCRQSFSFKMDDGHYFAKRIHYNGKHQPVYPMGARFMFAYNFDQVLTNGYHPDKNRCQPVRISLDYELHNSIYDYFDSIMRKNNAFGKGISVTVVDGNGRIRLLADYNPKKLRSADPNQEKELRKKMDEIYLNGDRAEERTLLKNRNIERLEIGPGSTIKVPFFVATAAGSKLNWENVKVHFPKGSFLVKGNPDVVKKYGNYQTEGIHKNKLGWDEMAGEYKTGETMNASRFITTSNNFYFGSMIGLATFSSTNLANGLETVMEAASPNDEVFPMFVYNGHYYKFKEGFIKQFGNSRALENGLVDNFHFFRWLNRNSDKKAYDLATTEFLFVNDTTQTLSTRTRTLNSEYIYSTRPMLYRDIKNNTEADVLKDIFHITSGGAKCITVSPLNMAEMYLRIAQLNAAENILTYDDDAKQIPYKDFSGADNFSSQMQNTTFLGMWNVIAENGGTLHNTTDMAFKNRLSSTNAPIYLYGKTGTVNDNQRNDNKHYAFILSNKRLEQTNNRDGLKVYVIYFGYYDTPLGHSGTANTRKEIIKRIVESETFQNYWNSDDVDN